MLLTSASEISQIISTVGFPIAMCLVMGFFIKYTTDTHREDLHKQQESHREDLHIMQQNHKETANRLANSIDENTSVLEELAGKISTLEGEKDE